MVNKVTTATVIGLDAYIVQVETDVINSLPAIVVVGLPDAAINEARARVRSAIKNSNYSFPDKKVVINLAPADLKKEGTNFDLPIAVGTLIEECVIEEEKIKDFDEILKDINSFEENEIDIEDFGYEDEFELNDDNFDDLQLLKESINNNITPLEINLDKLNKELDEIDVVEFDNDEDFELNDDSLDDLYETHEGINEFEPTDIEVVDNLNPYDIDEV